MAHHADPSCNKAEVSLTWRAESVHEWLWAAPLHPLVYIPARAKSGLKWQLVKFSAMTLYICTWHVGRQATDLPWSNPRWSDDFGSMETRYVHTWLLRDRMHAQVQRWGVGQHTFQLLTRLDTRLGMSGAFFPCHKSKEHTGHHARQPLVSRLMTDNGCLYAASAWKVWTGQYEILICYLEINFFQDDGLSVRIVSDRVSSLSSSTTTWRLTTVFSRFLTDMSMIRVSSVTS